MRTVCEVAPLTRRIGFMLELYKVAPSAKLERLRRELTPTYHRLDPTLPKSGRFEARWLRNPFRLRARRPPESCQQPHFLSQLPGASSESKHRQSGHHHF